jgi:hypothetical protein
MSFGCSFYVTFLTEHNVNPISSSKIYTFIVFYYVFSVIYNRFWKFRVKFRVLILPFIWQSNIVQTIVKCQLLLYPLIFSFTLKFRFLPSAPSLARDCEKVGTKHPQQLFASGWDLVVSCFLMLYVFRKWQIAFSVKYCSAYTNTRLYDPKWPKRVFMNSHMGCLFTATIGIAIAILIK